MSEQTSHNSVDNGSAGYEKKDINVFWIVMITVVVVGVIIVSGIVLNEYYISTKEAIIHETVLSTESAPRRDLRASEEEVLGSYKVLDQATGKYRIPIDRAMQLIANEAYEARLKK